MKTTNQHFNHSEERVPEAWFYDHQRRFKLFKKLENLHGTCTQQVISENQISEEWSLTKGESGLPDIYKFTGNRVNGATKVFYPSGKEASITEIEASGISPIRLTEY